MKLINQTQHIIYLIIIPLILFCNCKDGRINGGANSKEAIETIGAVPSTMRITKNGAAALSINIKVPPGIHGVAPKLRITYSSQSQNGQLGMGWNIAGISKITRIGAIEAIDKFTGGVAYNSNDRFALNGRRLINISGTHGTNNTVYHTEIESWRKIISLGQSGSGPNSFKVLEKSGATKEYGNTTESKILADAQKSVRVWAINKYTDRNGNIITYNYTSSPTDVNTNKPINSPGAYYPLRIDYTSNGAIESNRSVRFEYEKRQDIDNKYIGGSPIITAARLVAIKTFINESLIKTYQITYNEQTSPFERSKITSIQEIGVQNKLPATLYQYQLGANNYDDVSTALTNEFTKKSGWGDPNKHPITLADVNGDGRMDIVGFKGGVQVATAKENASQKGPCFNSSQTWAKGFDETTNWPEESVTPRYLVDVNGDGLSDVIGFGMKGISVALSKGSLASGGFDKSKWNEGKVFPHYGVNQGWNEQGIYPITFADVNGDQLTDIIGFKNGVEVAISTGKTFKSPVSWYNGFTVDQGWQATNIRVLADVNGDKLSDIVGFGQNGVSVGLSTGTGFETSNWNNGTAYSYFGINQGWSDPFSFPIALGDVNGDGLADIIGFKDGIQVAISTGKGFLAPKKWLDDFTTNQGWTSEMPRQLADINGDGMIDVIGYGKEGVEVALSTGTSFVKSYWNRGKTYKNYGLNQGWELPNIRLTADITGDGLVEIIGFSDTNVEASIHPGSYPDLCTTITNGLGNKDSISYSYLSNSKVYTYNLDSRDSYLAHFSSNSPLNATISVYNQRKVRGGNMNIVQSYTTQNDKRINEFDYSYTYNYDYTNARYDLDGRGWLGFQTVTKKNNAQAVDTETSYFQKFPFTGRLKNIETRCGANSTDPKCRANSILKNTNITYLEGSPLTNPIYNPYPNVFQVLKKNKTKQYFDYGTYKFSLGVSYTYDNYGNPIVVSNLNYVHKDGKDVSANDNVYTLKAFHNDASNWHIGYTKTQKKSSDNSLGSLNTISCDTPKIKFNSASDFSLKSWMYDDKMNAVSNCSWDNDANENTWLTYTYAYDQFGNTERITNPANNTTHKTYETVYNTYVDTKITPRNQHGNSLMYSYGYDPRNGKKVAVKNANKNINITVYDEFGRKTMTQGPVPEIPNIKGSTNHITSWVTGTGNFKSAKVITLSTYTFGKENGSIYNQEILLQGWPTQKQPGTQRIITSYVDGKNRVYKHQKSGDCGGKGDIIVTYNYNSKHKITKQTLPHFENDDAKYFHIKSYDVYGRIVKIDNTVGPTSSIHTMQYSLTNKGYKTITTKAAGTENAYKKIITHQFKNQKAVIDAMVVYGTSTAVTRYGYDLLGRKTWATDPATTSNPDGLTNTVVYDSKGRKVKLYNPAQDSIFFDFDKEGKLSTKTNANGTTIFRYDKLGRITERKLPDNMRMKFSYDSISSPNGLGKMTSAKVYKPSGALQSSNYYTYDTYGNKNKVVTQIEGDTKSYTTKWIFDPVGRTIGYTYPDGKQLQKVYTSCTLDTINLEGKNYITYDDYTALGAPKSITYGNGVTSSLDFNPVGSITSMKIKDIHQQIILNDSFEWNNINQITQIKDLNPAGKEYSQSFAYTDLRLTKASSPDTYGDIDYTYDASGNMIHKNGIDYTYKGHQVTVGKTAQKNTIYSASYNGIGNMTSQTQDDTTLQFIYDAENRLTASVNTQTKEMVKTIYDHTGRRIKKIDPDGVAYFYISDYYYIKKTPEYTQSTKYISGLAGKAVTIQAILIGKEKGTTTTQYLHQNQVSSTRLATKEDGTLGKTIFFKPYGEPYTPDILDTQLPAYTGKEYNTHTKLYYYGQRYYNPVIGRFISADNGLGAHRLTQDAFNRYEYVLGNPIKYNDPTGQMSCMQAFVAYGGAGGMLGIFAGAGMYYDIIGGASKGKALGWAISAGIVTTGIGVSSAIAKCQRLARDNQNDDNGPPDEVEDREESEESEESEVSEKGKEELDEDLPGSEESQQDVGIDVTEEELLLQETEEEAEAIIQDVGQTILDVSTGAVTPTITVEVEAVETLEIILEVEAIDDFLI